MINTMFVYQMEVKLPKLTASEFLEYNRLAEHMNSFHNHFRVSWNELYATRGSHHLSLRAASRFLDTLTMHHNIEETYVFPRLATHKLEAYLGDYEKGVRDLRMEEVQMLMDSWKDVLWTHLDREVEELGAEKMRQYWSIQEMKSFGF
ncbi:hypothetical protein EV426DRAFT_637731 [Tirmania nivea]|nr:hypothetical protein EV426DRAFT_637731 [Tirmania nivea]